MIKRFCKVYRWLLPVCIAVIVCTACGKEVNEKTAATIDSLIKENTILSEREKTIISDIQDFILKHKELEDKINEAKSWYEATEIVYKIRQYIDSVSAQIDTDYGSSEYIDRYFRVEKDELHVILDDYEIEEVTESFLITIKEPEILLPIGDKMWLRYGDESGDGLPIGLLVQNPTVDIGYQNARAGMFLSDIKSSFSTAEIECADCDWGKLYYLLYEDDSYRYYFISIDSRDNPAILYIEPNIKTEQAVDLTLSEEAEQEQKDTWHDEETDNEIGTDLNAQLKEMESELGEIEEKTQRLQMQYRLLTLLEAKGNEIKDENPELVYEKYLNLKQGELTRICEIEDMSELWRTGFIDSHFSFPAISIDSNFYVQYSNISDIYEYALPDNILITGLDIDLGYMGARAGMDFQEIQANAYEKEIQEGFMYTEDWTVYYIEYTDGIYDYIYYSDYPDGKDSWLIIL